jgi:putative solute:sodium symporter small subunit
MREEHARAYWKANVRILTILMSIWFFISFICGILLADFLDNFRFAGFKLGFWIAQQGSIYVFVILILVYLVCMDRLDARYTRDKSAHDSKRRDASAPAANDSPEDPA